ncbi:MAG TPA: HD domain-containing protein [Spirochaetota bacterium]|nr:HD domain-containing protein [Spirochaetota bacterium]
MEQFYDLEGLKQLALYNSYGKFIDLCGQLRFQIRWANLHRIPQTSVLGHSLFVAIFSYLFTLQIGGCPKRLYNNYFVGLFHDLPEVLTRDIISPVKKSIEGLSELIKEYEQEQMEKIVYPLLPEKIKIELSDFTEDEFENLISFDGKRLVKSIDEINKDFNKDIYNPRDGRIVKVADELSAFIEAYAAIENGNNSEEFFNAKKFLKNKYLEKDFIPNVDLKKIYNDFL